MFDARSYNDPYEPEYDDHDAFEEPLGEDEGEGDGAGGEDREGGIQNGVNSHQDYVASGDPAAAAAAAAAKAKDSKDFDKLAVPKDKRTTTPYMTKYEKARLLGTRALQIRYGITPLRAGSHCGGGGVALTVWAA